MYIGVYKNRIYDSWYYMTVLNSNLKTLFSLMLIIASYSYICYLKVSHNTSYIIINSFFSKQKSTFKIFNTIGDCPRGMA